MDRKQIPPRSKESNLIPYEHPDIGEQARRPRKYNLEKRPPTLGPYPGLEPIIGFAQDCITSRKFIKKMPLKIGQSRPTLEASIIKEADNAIFICHIVAILSTIFLFFFVAKPRLRSRVGAFLMGLIHLSRRFPMEKIPRLFERCILALVRSGLGKQRKDGLWHDIGWDYKMDVLLRKFA